MVRLSRPSEVRVRLLYDQYACSPARIRPVHKKMVFLAGSLKYVFENFIVIGAASMPSEHIWRAPYTSISTAPRATSTGIIKSNGQDSPST
jgi:hypothetical protein